MFTARADALTRPLSQSDSNAFNYQYWLYLCFSTAQHRRSLSPPFISIPLPHPSPSHYFPFALVNSRLLSLSKPFCGTLFAKQAIYSSSLFLSVFSSADLEYLYDEVTSFRKAFSRIFPLFCHFLFVFLFSWQFCEDLDKVPESV